MPGPLVASRRLSGRWRRRFLVGLGAAALLVAGCYAGQRMMIRELEQRAIETRRNGVETPLDFGAPFEAFVLPVADRVLQARLVRSPLPRAAAVLIFHGNGEAVSDWSRVQARLFDAGISSMVFDYGGFGDSTGSPSVQRMRQDGIAAYAAFVRRLPQAQGRFVFGHSLGNAVMLDALAELRPAPGGIIVHAGFTSAREMAVRTGLVSPLLAQLLPDLWDNQRAIAGRAPAVLVLHGTADEVIPVEMGRRLARSAGSKAGFQAFPGVGHDQVFQAPSAVEWEPVIDFIRALRSTAEWSTPLVDAKP